MTIYLPEPGDEDLWDGLMSSWLLALEAEGKSPRTLENYRWGPLQFGAWLTEHGHPMDVQAVTADLVRAWLRDLGKVRAQNTCRGRYVGLRQFISWCLAEGELDTDPLANVHQPVVHDKHTAMLTSDQLRKLLESMSGRSFADLRDTALVLFLADTGCRLSETVGLRLDDVDLRTRVARVTGKGSRPRTVPFGARTARALDKYLRARRKENYADRDWFWLGTTGKGRLTGNGVQQALRRRSDRIGLPPVHPHMFRHGFADAWLRAGGSETDLMELAGWRSRSMVSRYASANRAERAREAHRKLSPMDTL